jgi:hypothetical protein
MNRPGFMKIKSAFFFGRLVCFSVVVLLVGEVASQPIPQFKMYLSDKTIFSAAELPKAKPVILIYFDPDCDHCQILMKEVFKRINQFKSAEIVMVTFKSITELAAFEIKYNTHNYTNIKVGTEGNLFYLRNYYQLIKMPFTALYDKNKNLSYYYRQDTSVDDLLRRLKNLK